MINENIMINNLEFGDFAWRDFKAVDGKPNFTIRLDNPNLIITKEIVDTVKRTRDKRPITVEDLEKDGYNVRWVRSKYDPDDDTEHPQLKIRLTYKFYDGKPWWRNPVVKKEINGHWITLDADDQSGLALLDEQRIERADLVFGPFDWTNKGKSGRSASLREMRVVVDVASGGSMLDEYFNNLEANSDETDVSLEDLPF